MFCKQCGTEIPDNDILCEECKHQKVEDSVEVQEPQSTKSEGFIQSLFTPPVFTKAGIIVGISIGIQLVISIIVSIIANTALNEKMKSLLSGYINMGEKVNIFNPWFILRNANLSKFTIKFSMEIFGKISVPIEFKVFLLILLLIPIVGFFGGWLIYHKFIMKSPEDKGFNLRVYAMISAMYTIFFTITSFIPTTIMKEEGMSLRMTYSFFGALIGSLFVALVANLLTILIQKRVVITEVIKKEIVDMLVIPIKFFASYIAMGFVITLATVIVYAIKAKSVGLFFGFIAVLPNLLLMVVQLLLGGGISSSMGENDTKLTYALYGKVGLVLLIILMVLTLIVTLIIAYKKLYEKYQAQYWKYAGISCIVILVMQVIIFSLSSIRVKLSNAGKELESLGFQGVTGYLRSNLIIVLFVTLIIVGISVALVKILENKAQFGTIISKVTSNKMIIGIGILAVGFVLSLIFVAVAHSGKINQLNTENDWERDSSSYALEVDNISLYNGGYLIESGSDIFSWKKGKITELPDILKIYSDMITSNTDKNIVVESENGYKILNQKGKEVNKQEIKASSIAAISKKNSQIIFWLDGSLHNYNSDKNKFTDIKINGIELSEGNTYVVFNEKEDGLYLVDGTTAMSYNFKDGKGKVLEKEFVSFDFSGDTMYLFMDLEQPPVNIEDGKAAKYYIRKTQDSTCFVSASEEGEATILLDKIVNIVHVDYKEGRIVFQFAGGNDDYYEYNAKENELINISSEIRYSANKLLDKRGEAK